MMQSDIERVNESEQGDTIPPLPSVGIRGAVVRPYYEIHQDGINPELIPSGTKLITQEMVIWTKNEKPFGDNILCEDNFSTQELVDSWAYLLLQEKVYGHELLSYLIKHHILVGFYDVVTPVSHDIDEIVRREVDVGEIAFGVSTAALLASLDKKIAPPKSKTESGGMSRRGFLKAIGSFAALAAAWAVSPLAFEIPYDLSEQTTPIQRMIIRIIGVQSNFHPELAIYLLRNLIWAIKLSGIASSMEEIDKEFRIMGVRGSRNKNEGKPTIVANIGGHHSGFEDALRIGPRNCMKIIAALYWDSYIQDMGLRNYGYEAMATSRILDLEKGENGGYRAKEVRHINDGFLQLLNTYPQPKFTVP